MPKAIAVQIPSSYSPDVACPACGSNITEHIAGLYEGRPEHEIGGEHDCPECGSTMLVGVFRPEPVFSVHVTAPEGVANLTAERVKRNR